MFTKNPSFLMGKAHSAI